MLVVSIQVFSCLIDIHCELENYEYYFILIMILGFIYVSVYKVFSLLSPFSPPILHVTRKVFDWYEK